MEKFKKDMAAAKEEALAQLSEAWQKMYVSNTPQLWSEATGTDSWSGPTRRKPSALG